jgi:hypothetical protein
VTFLCVVTSFLILKFPEAMDKVIFASVKKQKITLPTSLKPYCNGSGSNTKALAAPELQAG